jgi:hemerythrin
MPEYVRICWDDQLLVGDPLIDTQHRTLIDFISRIYSGSTEADEAALNVALEYAGTHFAAEEELMKRVGYPHYEEHRRKHIKLTRILLGYKAEYEARSRDLHAFKHFMFHWVREHILEEDRRIGVFLATRGAGPGGGGGLEGR